MNEVILPIWCHSGLANRKLCRISTSAPGQWDVGHGERGRHDVVRSEAPLAQAFQGKDDAGHLVERLATVEDL